MSRLLAALDNKGAYLGPGDINVPSKRPSTPARASSPCVAQKRRRAGDWGLESTLGALDAGVAAAMDVPTLSQLLGASPSSSPVRPVGGSSSSVSHGFALNYDKDTEASLIDRGGEDQTQKLAEWVTRTIDNSSHGLTTQVAMEKLGLRSKRDLLPGMEVRLLNHQLIGVSWMVDQERKSPHKGGILADEMGLGKTVQMIATMAINQPEAGDQHRTTLIVVPAALLLQWKEEILNKTNGMFTVHIHHGKDKLKSVEAINERDAIITTYHTLNMDFSIPTEVDNDKEMQWLLDNGGLLAQTKWYRVILDESQFIRNRATRSSKSVAMLRAKYRWCLTGTPITNTLADIYGFLRFGRFRPWNDWQDFNKHIAKVQLEDAPLASLRAQEVLKPLMLRRTKDAELEGEPLLQLPEKHTDLVYLDFSEEERELYDNFEKRAQIRLNKFIRENTVLKNAQVVLVMILRLRQLSCHPNLILSQAEGFADPTMLVASDADKEVARATRVLGAKWATEVKKRFLGRARRLVSMDFDENETDDSEGTCSKCGDFLVGDTGRLLACGHEICVDCLDVLATSPIEHDGEFGNSGERSEKEFEAAVARGLRPCPRCKKMMDLTPARVFLTSAFEPSQDEIREANRPAAASRRRGGPAQFSRAAKTEDMPVKMDTDELIELSSSSDEDLPDVSQLLSAQKSPPPDKEKKGIKRGSDTEDEDADVHLTMDEIRNKRKRGQGSSSKLSPAPSQDDGQPREMSDALLRTWRRGDDNVEPSTKMVKMVKYLKEWSALGDKSIVFSQWTSMLDLCENLFARYGLRSLRYDGKMSRESREEVLKQLRKPGGPKVILISTKSGGIGLNLVSANRIVNLDLSWNYASESQAYDRVHRLGQEKEVFIKRLVVRNTIEERMLQLQDTKTGLAEAALGEGQGVKLHKLSVRELRALFGMTKN